MRSAPIPLATRRRTIVASALGALFEWYDFFLYGSLSSLATFGAGFVVRPLGALVFGRRGDLLGRKPTFLLTILIMGAAALMVGLLPTYEPPSRPGAGAFPSSPPACCCGYRCGCVCSWRNRRPSIS